MYEVKKNYLMNIVDIIVVAFLIFGFVRGLLKGLFVEVASLVAIIGGVYGAIHFSYFISSFLEEYVSWEEEYISITSFSITFIIIIVGTSLLGKVLTKIANFAALGGLNKILGGVFGALKKGLILSIIFVFFTKTNNIIPFVEKQTLEKSILFEPVKNIATLIFPSIIKNEIKDQNLFENI